MTVRILVTGGTFDKEYDELRGTLSFGKTHVPEMLALGRCRVRTKVSRLMMKDSLLMTAADRRRIVAACRRAPETRLVVTHGTDTMANTAAALGRALSGKTVVLTGAMRPYRFGSSDGLFNLGSALSFAQLLPSGVYIAMNGRIFPWADVRKDRKLGVFTRKARVSWPRRKAPKGPGAKSRARL
jgi:L-asparaginase